MALPFSDVDSKNGIIQVIESNLNFPDGHITGNSLRFKQFTRDVNLALSRALHIIFQTGGTWQFDDTNHDDQPTITTDLEAGRRDYKFVTDEQGNFILEVYKVMVADRNGNFMEMLPVDVPSGSPTNFWDGLETQGQPNTYDKLGNVIFVDPIPDYTRTDGLKVYINRDASFFTTSDTEKKPGFASLYHEYLALRPAYQYAYRNKLVNAGELEAEVLKMELAIAEHYKVREKDIQKTMMGVPNKSR